MVEPSKEVAAERKGTPPNEISLDADLIRAVPGLVRIAAGVWWRTNEWMVGASLRVGGRVIRAAVAGESPGQLLQDAGTEVRGYARRFLGFTGIEERFRGAPVDEQQARMTSLRDRGEELLRQSTDVHYEQGAHPAYERILGDLAPDEGRILRLLATEGPQPAVDVRKDFVPAAQFIEAVAPNLSELRAAGLSMIGAQAGVRYLERVPAYLNNLYRLGLVWFSREPLSDPLRYQVLEAQPDVLEALRKAKRGRTVRRSIHLTPFGADFCRVCLPLETAELEALPERSAAELEPPEILAPEAEGLKEA